MAVSFGPKAGVFPRGTTTRVIRVIPSVPFPSKTSKPIHNRIRCNGAGPPGGGGIGGGSENFWRDDFGDDDEPKRRFDSISFILGLMVLGIPSFYFKSMRDRKKKEERGYDSYVDTAVCRDVEQLKQQYLWTV